jgi:DNA-binding beta-propeller fold protein YncE
MNRLVLCVISAALLFSAGPALAADTDSLVLTQTIPLKGVPGKLDHLAMDAKGQRLFVANKPNNTLDIVDLKAGKLIKQIPDQGKVSGVTYAEELDMIFVGNGAGFCNAFDGKEYKQVFSVKAPNADNVHFHSGSKLVYVGQDEILSAFDAATGDLKAKVSLPGAVHGFRIDKKAGKIYAVLTKPNLVAVIDLSSHEVVSQFPLTLSDAGSPIAQDAETGLLFVGCPKQKPMVVVFDVTTGKEVGSVEIPAGIDDIHFDSRRNRVYASCGSGALVVIEKHGDAYEIAAQLETPKDSRTCAWKAGKIYLGVPKQEGKEGPEIRIYEARPVIAAKPAEGDKN